MKSTPPKKRISRVSRGITVKKVKPVHQFIHVTVIEEGKVKKQKKVACFFPDGSNGAGRDAQNYPHMEPHIIASRKDKLVWQSTAPFTVEITKNPDVFIGLQPWKSKPVGIGHEVESRAVDPNHPRIKQGKSVKAKFKVTIAGAEEYDPHIVVEP